MLTRVEKKRSGLFPYEVLNTYCSRVVFDYKVVFVSLPLFVKRSINVNVYLFSCTDHFLILNRSTF